MAKNTSSAWRVAPLQRVVAEPITDPAELAALDEQRRRARENGEVGATESASAAPQSGIAARVVDLWRQLSPAERGSLLARLGGELPTEQQMELLAQVLAQLGPESLPLLEGELTARLGARSD
jgi:hypothetical protein